MVGSGVLADGEAEMTMVEKVARAISGCVHEDREHPGAILAAARAAIEVMREPTQAMLKAPSSIMGGGFQNSHSDLETWEAMIDAALADNGRN